MKELTEIYNLQRNGANLIEVWEFVLSSPLHQAAYEQHYPQGKIAIQMWEFLLEKSDYHDLILSWEQNHCLCDFMQASWLEVLRWVHQHSQDREVFCNGMFLLEWLLEENYYDYYTQYLPEYQTVDGAAVRAILPELLAALEDESSTVRLKVLEILRRMRADAEMVMPRLAQALVAENDYTAEEVIDTLNEILGASYDEWKDTPEAVRKAARGATPALLQSLTDEKLQDIAAFVLGKIGVSEAKQAVPTLLDIVYHRWFARDKNLPNSGRSDAQKEAAHCLGNIGRYAISAWVLLSDIVMEGREPHYLDCCDASKQIVADLRTAVTEGLQALKQDDVVVRVQAIQTLGELLEGSGYYCTPSFAQTSFLCRQFSKIMGEQVQPVVSSLQQALEDDCAEVRQAAEQALHRVCAE